MTGARVEVRNQKSRWPCTLYFAACIDCLSVSCFRGPNTGSGVSAEAGADRSMANFKTQHERPADAVGHSEPMVSVRLRVIRQA